MGHIPKLIRYFKPKVDLFKFSNFTQLAIEYKNFHFTNLLKLKYF